MYEKKFSETKKLTKYKKSQNCPKFEQGVSNNVEKASPKNGAKNKKN